jgi:hypothetical protein
LGKAKEKSGDIIKIIIECAKPIGSNTPFVRYYAVEALSSVISDDASKSLLDSLKSDPDP